MDTELTTMFTGVNTGYTGGKIASFAEAVDLVNTALTFIKRSGAAEPGDYHTYPALVVYDPQLQCPTGGELAVAVTSSGSVSDAAIMAEQLRSRLQQSSLSVSGAAGQENVLTRGLKIRAQGDLAAIASLWQEKATDVKNETGIYVSAGIYDTGDGNVIIQGEANPRYFPSDDDKHAWEKAAADVIGRVSSELGYPLTASFRSLGFHYLRAKNTANSRGESF